MNVYTQDVGEKEETIFFVKPYFILQKIWDWHLRFKRIREKVQNDQTNLCFWFITLIQQGDFSFILQRINQVLLWMDQDLWHKLNGYKSYWLKICSCIMHRNSYWRLYKFLFSMTLHNYQSMIIFYSYPQIASRFVTEE